MVNLRFHIVSITAVFLSLAIGIFMGSTLLKRATVDSLRSRQASLEAKISERNAEIGALRNGLTIAGPAAAAFDADLIPDLVAARVTAPVLILAAQGVDTTTVASLRAHLTQAGALSLGTIWVDQRTDPRTRDRLVAMAGALGLGRSGSDAELRSRVLGALAAAVGSSGAGEVTSTTTTTSAPEAPTSVPGEPGEPGAAAPPAPDPWTLLLGADLVDWTDAPAGGLDSSFSMIIVSGEGADPTGQRLLVALTRRVASARSGALLVAETRRAASPLDDALRGVPPLTYTRGSFVGPLRDDGAVGEHISTVDDLDRPEGRLAAVLAVANLPGVLGDYGVLPGVDGPYPTPAR